MAAHAHFTVEDFFRPPTRAGLDEPAATVDEGHGFLNPGHVIDMYYAVDRFLGGHLGSTQEERTA